MKVTVFLNKIELTLKEYRTSEFIVTNCRKLNKRILFLLLVVLFPLYIFSQNITISGKVLNAENKEIMPGVNIRLCQKDSLVSVIHTDKKGEFCFRHLRSGDYLLEFSSLGFNNLQSAVIGLSKDYKLNDVLMEPASYQLDEVVVAAENVRQGVDRLTFFPNEKIRQSSQDALDVMRLLNLPDLKFDIVNHSFMSLKNGSVQIRINGVIASQTDLIAIQPQDIANIEYITNPGVIYGDGVAAVVLIKTRKNMSNWQIGGRVSQSLSALIGSQYAYFNLNFSHDHFSLKLSDSYNYANGIYSYIDKQLHYPTRLLAFKSIGSSSKQRLLNPALQFDFTHSFKENSFLSIKTFFDLNRSYPATAVSTSSIAGQSFYDDYSSKKDKVRNAALDVYFSNSFSNGSEIVADLRATYIHTDYQQKYYKKYNQSGYNNYESTYFATGQHRSLIGEIKYQLPLSKQCSLVIGSRNEFSSTRNDYTIDHLGNPSSLDFFNTYNYSEFSGRLRNFSYTIGAGFAFYKLKNDNLHRHYTYFRPKLSLRYAFSKEWSLQYYLGINPNEPELALLSNVKQPISEYEVRVGNPNLKPYQAYTNQLALNFIKHKTYLSLSTYLQYNSSPYLENQVLYDSDSEQFIYSMSNQGHFLHSQTRLYGSQKLFNDKLSLSSYGILNHYVNHADDYSNHFTAFIWGTTASYDIKHWGIAASFISPVRFLFNQVKTTQHSNFQLSTYYKTNRLQISLAVNNLFMPHAYLKKMELGSQLLQSKATEYVRYNNNYVNLTISYYLSKGKNKEYHHKIQNEDRDSGVMK